MSDTKPMPKGGDPLLSGLAPMAFVLRDVVSVVVVQISIVSSVPILADPFVFTICVRISDGFFLQTPMRSTLVERVLERVLSHAIVTLGVDLALPLLSILLLLIALFTVSVQRPRLPPFRQPPRQIRGSNSSTLYGSRFPWWYSP